MITVLGTRHVKATRKPWQCDGCARRFPAGTPKMRQRSVGDDGPYTWEMCPTCEAISKELWESDQCDFDDEGCTDEDICQAMKARFGSWEAADAHYAKPKLEVVDGGKP